MYQATYSLRRRPIELFPFVSFRSRKVSVKSIEGKSRRVSFVDEVTGHSIREQDQVRILMKLQEAEANGELAEFVEAVVVGDVAAVDIDDGGRIKEEVERG